MPEGPEVRRYADELARVLDGRTIKHISARTKNAKAWLLANSSALVGKRIIRVFAYGKNVIGLIDGGYYFYSHQMMWGRWNVIDGIEPVEPDRRERARVEVDGATAVLMSAPVFEIGKGDPFKKVTFLKQLGPNVLPYPGEKFDAEEFMRRLTAKANRGRTVGDALLDQTIVAGLGNYLRAEIMFIARINPWQLISELSPEQKKQLSKLVAATTQQAYKSGGFTVTRALRKRMSEDNNLVYVPGKEYGTRHYVFRRTNLPCLVCNEPVRQLRQPTTRTAPAPQAGGAEEEDKTRIVYFCANCQNVPAEVFAKPARKRARA